MENRNNCLGVFRDLNRVLKHSGLSGLQDVGGGGGGAWGAEGVSGLAKDPQLQTSDIRNGYQQVGGRCPGLLGSCFYPSQAMAGTHPGGLEPPSGSLATLPGQAPQG